MTRKMLQRAGSARATGDAGQMSVAVIVLMFLALLMAIFWIGLPIGQATDQKAGSQSAADAAALAAAEDIRDGLPNWIQDAVQDVDGDDLDGLFDGLEGRFGLEAAEHYADVNDATVTRYTYDHENDEIDVTVRSRAIADENEGQHSFSSAKAKLGLDLGDCELVDDPDEGGAQLRCGDLVLHFTVGADQGVTLDSDLDDLADEFNIRLSQ